MAIVIRGKKEFRSQRSANGTTGIATRKTRPRVCKIRFQLEAFLADCGNRIRKESEVIRRTCTGLAVVARLT